MVDEDVLLAEADLFAKGSLLTGAQLYAEFRKYRIFDPSCPMGRYAHVRLSTEILTQARNGNLTASEVRTQLDLLGWIPEPNKIYDYDVFEVIDSFIWLLADEIRVETCMYAHAVKRGDYIVSTSIESSMAKRFHFLGKLCQQNRQRIAEKITEARGVTLVRSLLRPRPTFRRETELLVIASLSDYRN